MTVTTSANEAAAETRILGGGVGLLPRVNLLPPEIHQRRVFRQIQAGLGGAVVAAVVLLGFLVAAASHGVTKANDDLAAAQAENARLRAQTASYANVSALYAAADAAQAQLVTAMGDEVRFSQLLNDLSLSIPSTVWITTASFGVTGGVTDPNSGLPVGTFSVSGIGFSHNDVGLWLESIAALKTYSDPYFSGSSESLLGRRKIVTFNSTATLMAPALSGRYSHPAGG